MAKNLLNEMSPAARNKLLRWVKQANEGSEAENKAAKRFRPGKTRNDRNRGNQNKNAENKAIRAEWQNDSKSTVATFPWHTCNGKRNRRQYTGKAGATIEITRQLPK